MIEAFSLLPDWYPATSENTETFLRGLETGRRWHLEIFVPIIKFLHLGSKFTLFICSVKMHLVLLNIFPLPAGMIGASLVEMCWRDIAKGRILLSGPHVATQQTPAMHMASVSSHCCHSAFSVSSSCSTGGFFSCWFLQCVAAGNTQHPTPLLSAFPSGQFYGRMPTGRSFSVSNFTQNPRAQIYCKFQKADFQQVPHSGCPTGFRRWFSSKFHQLSNTGTSLWDSLCHFFILWPMAVPSPRSRSQS